VAEEVKGKKAEAVNCGWCQTRATRSRQRFCFRCKRTTCKSTRCGVFSIPALTGENQVWICQWCIIEGLKQLGL